MSRKRLKRVHEYRPLALTMITTSAQTTNQSNVNHALNQSSLSQKKAKTEMLKQISSNDSDNSNPRITRNDSRDSGNEKENEMVYGNYERTVEKVVESVVNKSNNNKTIFSTIPSQRSQSTPISSTSTAIFTTSSNPSTPTPVANSGEFDWSLLDTYEQYPPLSYLYRPFEVYEAEEETHVQEEAHQSAAADIPPEEDTVPVPDASTILLEEALTQHVVNSQVISDDDNA